MAVSRYRPPRAVRTGRHLVVQAGTGTGKSLGYLVPSILLGSEPGRGHHDQAFRLYV